jgi:hypothetical protein
LFVKELEFSLPAATPLILIVVVNAQHIYGLHLNFGIKYLHFNLGLVFAYFYLILFFTT